MVLTLTWALRLTTLAQAAAQALVQQLQELSGESLQVTTVPVCLDGLCLASCSCPAREHLSDSMRSWLLACRCGLALRLTAQTVVAEEHSTRRRST